MAAIAAFLLFFVLLAARLHELIWLAWALGCIMILWMALPRPVAGIRIDDTHLTLSAWTKPLPIPLDEISHITVTEADLETEFTLVFKDGTEELMLSADMPAVDTLSRELAERGVPVRDLTV